MKKIVVFLSVVLAVLVIFACTLPTYIQIKGSPELIITAVSDFSEKFANIMREKITSTGNSAGEEFKILECTNEDIELMTFVIYRPIVGSEKDQDIRNALEDLWKEQLDLIGLPEESLTASHLDTPIGANRSLITNDKPNDKLVTIEMDNFSDFMEGFAFNSLDPRIYTDGTPIIDKLIVDIWLLDDGGNKLTRLTQKTGISGFDTAWDVCPWLQMPPHGEEIDGVEEKMNAQENLYFIYEVSLDQSTTLRQLRDWKENSQIRSELVIWFPFNFTAGPDGADFNVPEIFTIGDDIFGRQENNEDSFAVEFAKSIISMEMIITMNINPFQEGTLFVESWNNGVKQVSIPFELGEKTFDMHFADKEMEDVNNTIPFVPQLRVHYYEDDVLMIPRIFKTTELLFKAVIDYTKKLSEWGT
jgi:hypothetical protein